MDKIILTPKLAEKIQDDIFKKMTTAQKIKLVGSFFKFGKKLNELNGDRIPSHKNSRNIRKT